MTIEQFAIRSSFVHLQRLRSEAATLAALRGHKVVWDDPTPNASGSRITQIGKCSGACQAYVMIDTSPPANGIRIGGSAVAVGCPIEPEEPYMEALHRGDGDGLPR